MTSAFGRPYVAGSTTPKQPPGDMPFVLFPPYVHGRASATSWEVEQPVTARETQSSAELPSIQQFVDELPSISEFTAEETETPAAWPSSQEVEPAQAQSFAWPTWGVSEQPVPPSAWETDDWQGYDWGAAGRLAHAEPDPAAEAWASTDWSEPTHARASRQSAAEALASALDQIARRIRDGELSVPGADTVKDQAAITAALAAVLGIKR